MVRRLILISVLLPLSNCKSESSPNPDHGTTPDATTDASRKDVSAVDQPHRDLAPPDQSACPNVVGTYALTGTCSSPMLSMPSHACVTQTGCQVAFYTPGDVLKGTITAAGFSVTTKVLGVEETCTGTITGANIKIECKVPSMSITCSGTGVRYDLKDTASTCCDPAAQSCAGADRCSLVGFKVLSQALYSSACLAVTGTKKPGDKCTRPSENTEDVGRDDCEKGAWCTIWASPDGKQRYCRKLCNATSQCGSAMACYPLFGVVPKSGACVPTCNPAGSGAECSAGLACILMTDFDSTGSFPKLNAYCERPGTLTEGQACVHANDCIGGHKCENGVCLKMCDPKSSACTSPKTCQAIPTNFAPGIEVGVCK